MTQLPVIYQVLLAALTGLLSPLCFPHFDLAVLAWLVLIPLHIALGGTQPVSPRRAFWLGWLAGTIAFAGTMFWVVTAMHEYGRLPLAVSYLLMLLLALYLGLFPACYAMGWVWLNRRLPTLMFLAAPCLWVTLELGRTYLFSGLPWALLGYSQYQWLKVIQMADVTSVYGVSFLIVLVNMALTELAFWALELWRRSRAAGSRETPSMLPWPSLATAMLAMGLVLLYGHWRLAPLSGKEQNSVASITVGVVQANIDQGQKWDAAYRRVTMDRYKRLTDQAAPNTDLVLWPEAATPFLFEREINYQAEVMELARSHRTPLLLGSPALRRYPDGRPYLLNSAFLLSRDGVPLGRYDKRHLVPFGEYIPLHSSVLFFLDKLVVGIGDFEAGTVSTVLAFPRETGNDQVRFGVLICYEVIFPNLVREFAANGADFLTTITNDAWFGASSAPYQHFGMVVFRAVENRRAFARAANTGISGFIDPQGRILGATPIFEEAAVTGRIPLERSLTFYTKHGDVFAYACAIITEIFFLMAYRRDPAHGPVQL